MKKRFTAAAAIFLGIATLASLAQNNVPRSTGVPSVPQTIDPTTGFPMIAVPPSTDPGQALEAGKLAEEGDRDIPRALEHYRQAVRDFDRPSCRRAAAEALFRLGELLWTSASPTEAHAAYRRILREFADFADLAEPSQRRLAEVSDDGASTAFAPAEGYGPKMSPELMARYGLVRSGGTGGAAAAGSTVYTMSPELMRRYGLTAPADPSGSVQSTESSPNPQAASAALNPNRMVREVSGAVKPRNPAAEMLDEEVAALRGEMVQMSTQLRRVQRELRVTESATIGQIPASLVEDAVLNRLVAELQRAREDSAKARDLNRVELQRVVAVQEELAVEYFKGQYRPKLQLTEKALKEEIDLLKMSIDMTEAEANRLRLDAEKR
jgi:tetratricopeptide (TPR) repeat protein